MIDTHCHILPGIDDGAKTMAMALLMAQISLDTGVETVITTPHHGDYSYENNRAHILDSLDQFQLALVENKIPLKVLPGAELHLVSKLLDELENGIAMTYADQGKYTLLELPKAFIPVGAFEIVQKIAYMGIVPIIAHPERNRYFLQNPDTLLEWLSIGCKFQITAQSCTGQFGKSIKNVCKYWIRQGWIHLVASDAHRVERRSPDMRAGVDQIRLWSGNNAADILSFENPNRIIESNELIDLSNYTNRRNQQQGKFGLISRFFGISSK